LRKHAREGELSNAAWPGEEQRSGERGPSAGTAQSRDNLVSGELGKAHRSAYAFHHQ
jgi:hypothetical protein